MTAYALRLENSTDTAPRVRLGDAVGLQHKAGALNARSGLRPDGGGVVTAVAGTMGVQVAPFSGWVDGGASDAQGGYPFVLDASTTLTLSDGHASLARTDTLVARVQDDTYDGSGATDATVVVIEGTPGAGAPTLPTSCIPLRDVTVPAGLSAGTGGLSASHLATDRRTWTVAAGGILPVNGSSQRDALGAQWGQAVFRADTGKMEVYDGTSWAVVPGEDATPAFDSVTTDSLALAEGDTLTGIAGGPANGNTNGAGNMTVAHGLGGTPISITACSTDAGRHCAVTTVGSSTFTVAVTKADGSSHTSSAFGLRWIGII